MECLEAQPKVGVDRRGSVGADDVALGEEGDDVRAEWRLAAAKGEVGEARVHREARERARRAA